MFRIGIDVDGTNTDAVIVEGGKIVKGAMSMRVTDLKKRDLKSFKIKLHHSKKCIIKKLMKQHMIFFTTKMPTQNSKAEQMNTTASMFDAWAGEVLKEDYMDYHGLSNEDMARKTGMEVETMNGLVDGTIPMTAELSKKIGKVVGVDDDFYLGIQEYFDERLDLLEKAIIKAGFPTTMNEYLRQAVIIVAMSLLDVSKSDRKKAEFSPLYLQKITYLIDQEVSIDEAPIFEHEKHLNGPNDHGLNLTMDHLCTEGFVEINLSKGQKAQVTQQGKRIRNVNRRYSLSSTGLKLGETLLSITEDQVDNIKRIVNLAMSMSVSQLKNYVYEKYPLLNPEAITGEVA